MQLPAWQQAPWGQVCDPVQWISQVEAEQFMLPWHEFVPAQLALTVFPLRATAPAHDPFPEQVNVHVLPEQVTSLAQAPSPVQVT